MLHGGSAGVKNGTVSGIIYANDKNQLAGVTVQLERSGDPPIIRSTISNSEGRYSFHNVPVGKYSMGFSKLGFRSVSTQKNATGNTNSEFISPHIYVESSSHVRAPSVVMQSVGLFGRTDVRIRLIDQITGEAVNGATITLGNQATDKPNNLGEYTLVLNIPPTEPDDLFSKLTVSAPGFENLEDQIKAIPQQQNSFTVPILPQFGRVEGHIDFSNFPGSNLGAVTSISVNNIPSDFLNAKIEPSGFFSLQVPVSSKIHQRLFDIKIHTRGFQPLYLKNIPAPEAGLTTINQPIKLIAITTSLNGKVVSQNGKSPAPSGINQVFISELGVSASITNGEYFFQAIPTGIDLTLVVFIMNQSGKVERTERSFQATVNGKGIFTIPTLITESSENSSINTP